MPIRHTAIIYFTLFGLILCSLCLLSHAIELKEAYYDRKMTNLVGNRYEYAMFEAQYDEELYILRQWGCACQNATSICPLSPSKTLPAVVDETGYDIQELQEGVWVTGVVPNDYELRHFKFDLSYSASIPCPMIMIDYEMELGALALFMSTNTVPSQADYQWFHAYYGSSSFAICPSNPLVGYGTYYITLQNQFSQTYNAYKLRFRIVSSPTCSALVPPDDNDDPDSPWIVDGQFVQGDLGELEYAFFKLETPGPCTNVTASVYSWGGEADFDILASIDNSRPNFRNKASYFWNGAIDGDDTINFHYCNPNPLATTNTIYFGIRTITPGTATYNFIATSLQWEAAYPLSQLAFLQAKYALSYGATPNLNCSDHVYTCRFIPYIACSADTDYDCCYQFGPISLTEALQPLWPWPEDDETIGSLSTTIAWNDIEPNVPGKLAWSLRLGYADSEGTYYTAFSDPSTCRVILGTSLLDRNGSPVTEPISFTPKPKTCEYDKYKEIAANISTTTDGFLGLTTIEELALQQLRLSLLAMREEVSGCQAFVSKLLFSVSSISSVNATFCSFTPDSVEWASDPCCNPEAALTSCCAEREFPITQALFGEPNFEAINSQCRSRTCAANAVTQLSAVQQETLDEERGCQAIFNEESSLARLNELSSFIDLCRESLMGTDLLGSRCNNDSDCSNGAPCDPIYRRCNHTTSDVIGCIAQNMDYETATILFNSWGIREQVDTATLALELEQRVVVDQCVGGTAMNYRQSYHFIPQITDCVDTCKLEGREPKCFDRSASTCIIPDDCDGAQTDGACYRFWSPVQDDLIGCTQEKACNWIPCDGLDDCEATCFNSTGNVCLSCSDSVNGQCTAVPLNQAQCEAGMCSTNSSITNEAECLLTGACSISCPTCDTETGCQAGTCSDALIFNDAYQAEVSGACLYDPLFDDLSGESYCEENDVLTPIGCTNLTATSQAMCDSRWYTLATTTAECTSNAGYGCYDFENEEWTSFNQSECEACSATNEWIPIFEWTNGTWTRGEMKPLLWTPREYKSPNKVAPSINFSALIALVKSAITNQFSFSYITEALCRYRTPVQLAGSLSCDCGSTYYDPNTCYAITSDLLVGKGTACPFLASSIRTRVATIQIPSNALSPSEGCQNIAIEDIPASNYKIDSSTSVSQALFRDTPTNDYWVVRNAQNAYVGQIISGGIEVTWNFSLEQPVQLCINPDESIGEARIAEVYGFGLIDQSAIISPIDTQITRSENGAVCAYISEPGTYFALKLVPRYLEEDGRVSVVQYRVGAALYLMVAVFAIVQATLLSLDYKNQRIYSRKMVFIAVIFVNCIVRTVYVLLPANAFGKGMDSIQFIIFELPTFLYFSVFTAIMYMWLLVVLKTYLFGRRAEMRKRESQMRKGFILGNCFIYLIFVVFIYLIAILPGRQKPSPCFLGASDTTKNSVSYNIKLAYWIFQAVIVVLVSAGFVTGAVMLVRLILEMRKTQSSKNRRGDVPIYIISLVAAVCIVFLLIRSAIFLWSAITSRPVNVIGFVILETIPQAMLLFYINPFKYFKEDGRSSSTKGTKSTGRKGNDSRTRASSELQGMSARSKSGGDAKNSSKADSSY